MKITDMILVTENWKGTESNFLMTVSDYMNYVDMDSFDSRKELADVMVELGRTLGEENGWSEIYFTGNKSLSARFCNGGVQLQKFLQGTYNSTDQQVRFDEERCSKECMEKLRVLGMNTKGWIGGVGLSYTKLDAVFEQGQILHNFNNRDYRVMEKLSEKNLLLMDIDTGNFTVAQGVALYARCPSGEEFTADNSMTAIEWEHGVYFGNTPSAIDFRYIRQNYGSERKMESLSDYREMLEDRFCLYSRLSDDELLSESLKKSVIHAMYEEFHTCKLETFDETLEAGVYDHGFLRDKEPAKGKAR